MKAVFDSDVVIDFLNGVEAARDEIERYETRFISPITWIESQVKAPPGFENEVLAAINAEFVVAPIDPETIAAALELRRSTRLKLPDSFVLACARVRRVTLVTRNRKDFRSEFADVRIPYSL